MKSLEEKLHEALAELKKTATATKYAAVAEEIGKLKTLEQKVNCVERSIKESAPIRKNLGRLQTFVEGDPFRINDQMTTTGTTFTEADGSVNEKLEGRVKSLVARGFEEAEARVFLSCELREGARGEAVIFNVPPTPKNFTTRQKNDYQFFRHLGINESEALAMAKVLPAEIKEAGPNRF